MTTTHGGLGWRKLPLPLVSGSLTSRRADRQKSAVRLIVAFTFLLGAFVGAPEAGAQRTPGLDEARAQADRLAQEISDAETELSQLELRTLGAQTELDTLETEAGDLLDSVRAAAVLDFTNAGSEPNVFAASGDFTSALRAGTLNDAAIGADTEALEDYAALFEDLELARADLATATEEHEAAFAELVVKREELGAELAKLEEIEAERLAEERRKAEEARLAAAAAAAAAGNSNGGGGGGNGGGNGGGGGDVNVISGGSGLLTVCPVAGAHSFIDSWGYPRSGGRRHKGVDIMANIGVPIVAPVSGTVSHRSNRVGGRSFHLNGNDGNYYYGTHLSSYGNSGSVNAGDVIGYVGDDGNARGIPHLHFEIHPGGGAAVNPYPATRAACG